MEMSHYRLMLLTLWLSSLGFFIHTTSAKAFVPDFASIKIEEINIRSGPGKSYPIKYVYKKRGMPVKLLKEYDNWYQIEDFEGDFGWATKSYISTNFKTIIVTRDDVVYSRPRTSSTPIFRVEKNVVMNVLKCKADFCKVSVNNRRGWINKGSVWGTW